MHLYIHLQNGAVCNTIFQPHEAHIPYHLQFMIDYNLHGMNFIKLSTVINRTSYEQGQVNSIHKVVFVVLIILYYKLVYLFILCLIINNYIYYNLNIVFDW